jgi:hypothetical protein
MAMAFLGKMTKTPLKWGDICGKARELEQRCLEPRSRGVMVRSAESAQHVLLAKKTFQLPETPTRLSENRQLSGALAPNP